MPPVSFASVFCFFSSLFFVDRIVPLLSLHQHFQTTKLESTISDSVDACWDRPPPVWPRSLNIVQRRVPDPDSKVGPATTVTYYDYELGGNLIQITDEEGDVLWDLELNTGHSYYFRPAAQTCRPVEQPVGILRPNWLEGATALGPSQSWDGSGRVVCGWTKVDFIDYYVDKATGLPDNWYFHTMKASFQVLNYTENPTIDPALFVPPEYCNQNAQK